MAKWVFMTDPATGNIGLYDEPTPGVTPVNYENPNSACNAPLNSPESNIAYVYWHILLDNMEVQFDTTVAVNHAAFSAGTTGGGTDGGQSAAYDIDTTFVDHDLYTHGLGYELFAMAAISDKILTPGYPVQIPVVSNGSSRYVTLYSTTTKVFLREFRSRGSSGLDAVTINYRLLGFRQQRPMDGNDPPRLIDFDAATGILKMGDGRWSSDRRYLQVVPGGTPFGLTYGRTLDLKNGAYRLARSDGTTYDPIPTNTMKTGVHAGGGTFATDPLVYGSAFEYNGTWTPSEIIQVQAP